MQAPPTKHEQAIHDEEQRVYWTRRVQELKGDLMARCPAGRVLDDDHLAAILGQQWSTNRPVLLARRFVRRGLAASGFTDSYVEAILGPEPTRGEPARVPPLYWDPPDDALADIPEQYRELFILTREGG